MTWTNIPNKDAGGLLDETWYDTHFKANVEWLRDRMPTRVTMWHDEALVTHGNSLVYYDHAGAHGFPLIYHNPPANGDSFTNTFFLKAGSYTIYWQGFKGPWVAKIDWALDGAPLVTGQDWYSASNVENAVQSAPLTISEDGMHVLRGTVNGRHPSSTGYLVYLSKYWIKPTSD